LRLPLALAALLIALPAAAQTGGVDYARDEAWLCRPGRADACAGRLDALTLTPDGRRTPAPFKAAADPAVDCFYVYPTVSTDGGMYSDLNPGPEERRTALVQAARFRSVCRVFAPSYRQVTMMGLGLSVLLGGPDWSTPYADVRAAWRDYLRRDNGGRGVVLIGHSQGAIMLGQLLSEEIERNPDQRRLLVSAVLAGHPGVPVPEDEQVGAELGVTPLCRSRTQTGCAVVFATYAEEDAGPARFFGRTQGRAAACVHPGAPGGGRGPLRAFLPAPADARPGDPPFVEVVGQLEAECRADRDGAVLRVRVAPGPNAEMLRRAMAESVYLPSWGLHVLDMPLTQGSLLEMVDAQARAWTARTRTVETTSR
jgi:hypothetical protein